MSQTAFTSTDPASADDGAPTRPAGSCAPVAAIVVTWNRREDVCRMIGAIAAQRFPLTPDGPERDAGSIDLVVVDNASTDGTLEAIVERWGPDRIIDNPTERAHEPAFGPRDAAPTPNRAGFRSLTVVRNTHNHGGCGGFNTGFACIAWAFGEPGAPVSPEFVWLVDDDADLPPDALGHLIKEMRRDERVGLVGSRAVSIVDRATTIETTIFYDRANGRMTPHAPPGHPEHDAHLDWVIGVGGTLGRRDFRGARPVDVVSACSMLSRWKAVERVGFWDWRYFIYCDDADWCLRFARAGWKVVLSLDAVVYHTPWNLKLTPARMYYAQRNALWMTEKVLGGVRLKLVVTRWLLSLLKESLKASFYRRLTQASILRTTAHDIAAGVTGKTAPSLPSSEPVGGALARACTRDRRVAVVCATPGSIDLADRVRANASAQGATDLAWTYLVRRDVAELADGREDGVREGVRWLVYDADRDGRIWAATRIGRERVGAPVVFDFHCDVFVPGPRWTLHVEARDPASGRLEDSSFGARARFVGRWARTLVRCLVYGLRVRRNTGGTRYG